jgi:hypothetical protein
VQDHSALVSLVAAGYTFWYIVYDDGDYQLVEETTLRVSIITKVRGEHFFDEEIARIISCVAKDQLDSMVGNVKAPAFLVDLNEVK